MQINNSIHYSSDPYLISKKQYEVDHKTESQNEERQTDISTTKLEEKLHAKSVNALQPLQAVESREKVNSSTNSVEKVLASYNAVENGQSNQEQFDSIKEMV